MTVAERKKKKAKEEEKTRELKEGRRKIWQWWVIAERIERVQLHLMVGEGGVIACVKEIHTHCILRIFFFFSFLIFWIGPWFIFYFHKKISIILMVMNDGYCENPTLFDINVFFGEQNKRKGFVRKRNWIEGFFFLENLLFSAWENYERMNKSM